MEKFSPDNFCDNNCEKFAEYESSRSSSLKTNSKVREVREKSVIDSPRDNEHESSNEREVRAQHDEADYLEKEREVEREEEIERRERERNEESEDEEDDFRSLPPQFKKMSNQLQVCNYLEPFKREAEKLTHDTSKKFTDYRNKYNEAIILLVKDMHEIEREIPTNISDHKVNKFISEDIVIKKLLRRQLAVVDTNKLKKISSLKKLIEFTHKSFKIHWKSKDLEAIKKLDYITKEIYIPS
ncbi:hypothetical protein C1646_756663 [Rhizophagus diaphanus]|nr:hypothetical protein C1646_756663 [Rhizophagus diaphanus] [Rhizophagus sp. MUCL 43196]